MRSISGTYLAFANISKISKSEALMTVSLSKSILKLLVGSEPRFITGHASARVTVPSSRIKVRIITRCRLLVPFLFFPGNSVPSVTSGDAFRSAFSSRTSTRSTRLEKLNSSQLGGRERRLLWTL